MSNRLDAYFASARTVAGEWQRTAESRRLISVTDPIADTLDFCATELLKVTRDMEDATQWLTTEEFAALHNCTPQTVRNWIRRGELDATDTGTGYLIHRRACHRKEAAA